MAAAVELATAGIAVNVFEASRTLGGRARGVDIDGLRLDNGAHILVGAYRETLRLMELVDAPTDGLRRLPLHLEFPGRFAVHAPRLPAPFHLAWAILTARGLALADKLATIAFMRRQKRRRFRLEADTTVDQLLAGQPAAARRFLWEPLCLAALNTPPAHASAQVFLNVLRDSLAADRAASDLLLPATDFSSLFPEPAAKFVEARGGMVRRGERIAAIERHEDSWYVDRHGPFDSVIVAVAPQHVAALLGRLPEMAPTLARLAAYIWEPIVTAYLRYPAGLRLPFPMIGIDNGTAQWLFDRGESHGQEGQQGLIAAVISARGRHRQLGHDALLAAIHGEIERMVPGLPAPRRGRVIIEKRATFACTPGLDRPGTTTPLTGLLLAGDYVAGDYPATLEGAVRSGVAAAWLALNEPPGRQP